MKTELERKLQAAEQTERKYASAIGEARQLLKHTEAAKPVIGRGARGEQKRRNAKLEADALRVRAMLPGMEAAHAQAVETVAEIRKEIVEVTT